MDKLMLKSIEMNNRAFKKIDLNHVFVCVVFLRKVWRFFLSKFWWGFHFFHVFFLLKYSPETFTQAFKRCFFQLRWPHHNFYGRKMHCRDRSVTVSRLVLDGWFWRKPTENDLWCFFRCIPNRNLKHLRTCFESCPKDQRFLPLQWKGEWSCFLQGCFLILKKKTSFELPGFLGISNF